MLPACLFAAPVQAADEAIIDVPAGRLSVALITLGKQAGVPIGLIDEKGGDVRTRGVKGRLRVDEALRRLLAGTGFIYRRTRAGDLVVVRDLRPVARSRTLEKPTKGPSSSGPPVAVSEIVVTASKSSTMISDYPGSVSVVDLGGDQIAARPGNGTAVLIDQLPILSTTSLGPGRNKIYARGIADSSFAGQSQANVAFYLGDVRLNYNGPDPDLNLFDVRRVEVLAGPYGTLYGAGALGGVVRIEPNAPDPAGFSMRLSGQASTVRHGASGYSGAAMANLPLSGHAAVRVVGYRVVEAGYIDDSLREEKDVNRIATTGGRGALRLASADDIWTVDAGLVFQRIKARDIQYTNGPDNELTSRIAQAQPYSSDYLMPTLTAQASWGNLSLVSATGWSRQRNTAVSNSLDLLNNPERLRFELLTHETRVSGRAGRLHFVAGVSFARNLSREYRETSIETFRFNGFELRGKTTDVALFGEGRIALSNQLEGTAGLRVNYIRNSRISRFPDEGLEASATRAGVNLLPSASLAWKPEEGLLLFLGYRSGSRGGNLLPLPDADGARRVLKSDPDRLTTIETGWRWSAAPSLRLSSTFSYTRWRDVQADLVTVSGNYRTVNLGRIDIWGLEASALWNPPGGWSLGASTFLNNGPAFTLPAAARLIVPDGFLGTDDRVPNIASVGARASIAYEAAVTDRGAFRLAAALRYYGASVAEFERRQPRYMEVGAEARLTLDRWVFTLAVTNLTDVRGNRFALGNQFAIFYGERQTTPLQPRTVRFGVDILL